MSHRHHAIDYVELRAPDVAAAKSFYATAFGWTFTEYGPAYAGFSDGRTHDGASVESGGIMEGDASPGGPLVILYSQDLEATRTAIVAAGGTVVKDIYAFPGGRRFELADPAGNVLAVWSDHS